MVGAWRYQGVLHFIGFKNPIAAMNNSADAERKITV
jgi:hypothetical protein